MFTQLALIRIPRDARGSRRHICPVLRFGRDYPDSVRRRRLVSLVKLLCERLRTAYALITASEMRMRGRLLTVLQGVDKKAFHQRFHLFR